MNKLTLLFFVMLALCMTAAMWCHCPSCVSSAQEKRIVLSPMTVSSPLSPPSTTTTTTYHYYNNGNIYISLQWPFSRHSSDARYDCLLGLFWNYTMCIFSIFCILFKSILPMSPSLGLPHLFPLLHIYWYAAVGSNHICYTEMAEHTGPLPLMDPIIRRHNILFCHVIRLAKDTPAHQALQRQIDISDHTWKRPPGRPRIIWLDQIRSDTTSYLLTYGDSYPLRLFWGDAMVPADTRSRQRRCHFMQSAISLHSTSHCTLPAHQTAWLQSR